MRPWVLNLDYIEPFHSYSLAYCRPIHLFQLNFKTLTTIWALYRKAFSSLSIVIILQSVWSLWLRFFLQTIGIIRYKILRLKEKKIISFWSLAQMSLSTYLRPNIHQNNTEILGVNCDLQNLCIYWVERIIGWDNALQQSCFRWKHLDLKMLKIPLCSD
jgi:hypothetical protein